MVKERRTELVEGFRHSVPYINAHRGKTFVIMLGGEAIEHENFSNIVNDIGLLLDRFCSRYILISVRSPSVKMSMNSGGVF